MAIDSPVTRETVTNQLLKILITCGSLPQRVFNANPRRNSCQKQTSRQLRHQLEPLGPETNA